MTDPRRADETQATMSTPGAPGAPGAPRVSGAPSTPVLAVRDLERHYPVGRSLRDVLARRPPSRVRAVDGIGFEVAAGESLAIVGESGCGKSTTANLLLGLEPPSAGSVAVMGRGLSTLDRAGLRRLRREVQIVFQDPYESLNPRQSVEEVVREPLQVHGVPRDERDARVDEALAQAGLTPPEVFRRRLPHQLSGGQRQRVCVAAALALRPRVLVADEPVSMLDVSTRAEVLNLLTSLARDQGLAIVMITHDLSTVAAASDRIAVMYLGRIVEIGPTAQVLRSPQHPYTQALLSVVPVPDPARRRAPVLLQGEPPDAAATPPGCRFHPRCPVAEPRCATTDPKLHYLDDRHAAACVLIEGTTIGTLANREP